MAEIGYSFSDAEAKVLNFSNVLALSNCRVRYTIRRNDGVKVVCSVYNAKQEKDNTVMFYLNNVLSITKVEILDAYGKLFVVDQTEFDEDVKALAS